MTSSSYYYRFAILAASVTAVLTFSACQPAAENNEATSIEEVVAPSVDVAETDIVEDIEPEQNISEEEENKVAEDPRMTDMFNDYTRAMSRMNDEMMIGMGYNDPDTAFAKSMLGHHRGTVDMAQIQLKYGTDVEMRKLAQDIIDAQRVKIDKMRRWLASHPDAANSKPDTQTMQQDYAEDIEDMHEGMTEGMTDSVIDMAFARSMLPLHVGAVDMALIQLKYGTDEEMRQLAQEIIGAQQPQIKLMQDWIALHKTDDIVIDEDAIEKGADSQELAKQPAT